MKTPGNQRLVALRSLPISRVEAQTLVPAVQTPVSYTHLTLPTNREV